MTTQITVSVRINAPKEQVWKTLANLGDVMNYSAHVNNSYYDSEETTDVGCSRICELDGMTVRETAVEWIPGERYMLKMEFLKGSAPIEDFRVGPHLKADGEATIVTYKASYDVKFGIIGKLLDHVVMQNQNRKVMKRVLDGLKHHIETGETIVGTDVLKEIPAIASTS